MLMMNTEKEQLTFDELADIGETMRMSEEELDKELLKSGITPEDVERSRLKMLKLIELQRKKIETQKKERE